MTKGVVGLAFAGRMDRCISSLAHAPSFLECGVAPQQAAGIKAANPQIIATLIDDDVYNCVRLPHSTLNYTSQLLSNA